MLAALALAAIILAISLLPTREPGAESPWPAVTVPQGETVPMTETANEAAVPRAPDPAAPPTIEPAAEAPAVDAPATPTAAPRIPEPPPPDRRAAAEPDRRAGADTARDYRDLRRYWLDGN